MKKIYKTLLVSVFSSTLVINTWGDVFDVTEERDDKGIKGLVNELKEKIKEGGDCKDKFGKVIETHQEGFSDLVSKYIASKIGESNLNELLKQVVADKTKLNINELDVDNEEAVRYCFQMPGIAVWVPDDGTEMKIYIAMKRRALKNGEKVADNSGDSKNLLSFSENMHTERQLVLAALTNNGEGVDYGNVSDALKRENSWHKKGGKLYIYLPAAPCHDSEGIPTQSSNSNTTNNKGIFGGNSNNNKNNKNTNEKGGMHCVGYFRSLKKEDVINNTCKLIVFFPGNNIRVTQTDKGIVENRCFEIFKKFLDGDLTKIKENVKNVINGEIIRRVNSEMEALKNKWREQEEQSWKKYCETLWKTIVDDYAAEYVALPPIKKENNQ